MLIRDIISNSCQDVHYYTRLEEWRKCKEASQSHEYEIIQIFNAGLPHEAKLDILVQVSGDQSRLQDAIHYIKPKGYAILNSDSMNKMDLYCRDIYAVSYGFNSKATVTASSIDDVQGLSFSYYLQRAVPVIGKGIIQPFEIPISLSGETQDIHSCLAAYTCIMILGFEI